MPRNPWFRTGFYAWSLGLEASSVIALRTLKIAARGVAAEAETRRMVSEKLETGLALQALALTGGLGLTGPQRRDQDAGALPTQSACEQAPAGKRMSRQYDPMPLPLLDAVVR
jgi:hypothetical protein